ncbi:helix-turn-helix domain-containing protein [Streptomyces sp. NBC_00582]|nr:helix-turn-helix domain-containing protein [Streptomyces sp. NBC_00582]
METVCTLVGRVWQPLGEDVVAWERDGRRRRAAGSRLGGLNGPAQRPVLAADTAAAERLRATLLLLLAERGSHTATAERLHLQKNTVEYRVDKAARLRGKPLDQDRLDLELALTPASSSAPRSLHRLSGTGFGRAGRCNRRAVLGQGRVVG